MNSRIDIRWLIWLPALAIAWLLRRWKPEWWEVAREELRRK